MRHGRLGIAVTSALFVACVSSELTLAPPEEQADVAMRGAVRDWKDGLPVSGATVSTVGIAPGVQAVTGSDGSFVLENLPASGFVILEVAAEGRLRTFSPAILVGSVDLEGVDAPSITIDDGASIYAGFGVVSSSGATVVGRALLWRFACGPSTRSVGVGSSDNETASFR